MTPILVGEEHHTCYARVGELSIILKRTSRVGKLSVQNDLSLVALRVERPRSDIPLFHNARLVRVCVCIPLFRRSMKLAYCL
jgi:hypothetical protein